MDALLRDDLSPDRGANENKNGLVRQYFPKGTDFGAITNGDVRKVAEHLLYKFNIVALTS